MATNSVAVIIASVLQYMHLSFSLVQFGVYHVQNSLLIPYSILSFEFQDLHHSVYDAAVKILRVSHSVATPEAHEPGPSGHLIG